MTIRRIAKLLLLRSILKDVNKTQVKMSAWRSALHKLSQKTIATLKCFSNFTQLLSQPTMPKANKSTENKLANQLCNTMSMARINPFQIPNLEI